MMENIPIDGLHCHLNFEGLANRLPEVLSHMAEEASQTSAGHQREQKFARKPSPSPNGIRRLRYRRHPSRQPRCRRIYRCRNGVARQPRQEVVGIGETGLDYHWCKGDLAWQRRQHCRPHRSGQPNRAALDCTPAMPPTTPWRCCANSRRTPV